MSAYANFYIRINDTFAPIGEYCRNSEIYWAVQNHLAWEKIRPLNARSFDAMISTLSHEISDRQNSITSLEKKSALIMSAANNSLDEKMAAIEYIQEDIKELENDIAEAKYAINVLHAYQSMIDSYRYSDYAFENDADHYIYAGIEAEGTLENVIE